MVGGERHAELPPPLNGDLAHKVCAAWHHADRANLDHQPSKRLHRYRHVRQQQIDHTRPRRLRHAQHRREVTTGVDCHHRRVDQRSAGSHRRAALTAPSRPRSSSASLLLRSGPPSVAALAP
jgi:hypothetical protein